MVPIDLDREWGVITAFLPEDWRELAWKTGAMRRHRGAIRDETTLLRTLLLYAAGDLSLRTAVLRAREHGLVNFSDEALMKRLKSSSAWLALLTQRTFTGTRRERSLKLGSPGRLFRAIDATSVAQTGKEACYWKIHYSVGLPDLRCDYYRVTDARGTETFKNFPVTRGDVLLADRGYCHREGVAHIVKQGGEVIVRLNHTNFPLLGQRGAEFELLPQLRRLEGLTPGEWKVTYEAYGKRYPARLCALRKTVAAAAEAKQKIRRESKSTSISPKTLEAAEYIFVLATAGLGDMTAQEVLEAYRLRWQIELAFKRLKSLLNLDLLRQKKPPGAKAWLQAKLLVALLTERLLEESCLFSPWGYELATSGRHHQYPGTTKSLA